jgi:hypothetical protein
MNRTKLLFVSCSLLSLIGACVWSGERGNGLPTNGAGGGGGRAGQPGIGGHMITPCQGLQCAQSTCASTTTGAGCLQPACTGGAHTTVSGTIYDPAGQVALFGVNVYVPNAPLTPIADGPSCDPCNPATGTTSLVSGSPIALTTTDTAGKFTLGGMLDSSRPQFGDVPAGTNIPLVIQVGKWQRQIVVPQVNPCVDNPITDLSQSRLPANQSEGHLPRIALTTGNLDALECLIRKVGVSDSEFTTEAGTGRVNFFTGGGGTSSYDAGFGNGQAGMNFTPVHPWWDSLSSLMPYDIIMHSCEGGDGQFTGGANPSTPTSVKSVAARQALQDYADMGGRVFASHWHVYWFEEGPAAFQSIATWDHLAGLPNPYTATIDETQTDGMNLGAWLLNNGGSPAPGGTLAIAGAASMTTVAAVAGGKISERWIYAADRNPQSVQYLSATTPVNNAAVCGRVVFSDIHVSGGAGSSTPDKPYPTGCTTTPLSPQEKALEFMLFDIGTCVTQVVIPG